MPLLKAQKSFNTFRTRLTDDQLKAGALKAFEYCVELSLKTMQDYLEIYETVETICGSRDTVGVAARLGLIKDAELWFKFIESRNALLHAYEEAVVTAAVDLFSSFSKKGIIFFMCYCPLPMYFPFYVTRFNHFKYVII